MLVFIASLVLTKSRVRISRGSERGGGVRTVLSVDCSLSSSLGQSVTAAGMQPPVVC